MGKILICNGVTGNTISKNVYFKPTQRDWHGKHSLAGALQLHPSFAMSWEPTGEFLALSGKCVKVEMVLVTLPTDSLAKGAFLLVPRHPSL